MRLEITGVITLMSVVKNERIFVKTFDGFDVYVNGKLIYFPSSKAKEMLDFYEFIEGNPDYGTLFSGSYMPEYSWAEDTLPYLKNLYRKYNGVLK